MQSTNTNTEYAAFICIRIQTIKHTIQYSKRWKISNDSYPSPFEISDSTALRMRMLKRIFCERQRGQVGDTNIPQAHAGQSSCHSSRCVLAQELTVIKSIRCSSTQVSNQQYIVFHNSLLSWQHLRRLDVKTLVPNAHGQLHHSHRPPGDYSMSTSGDGNI